MTETLLITGASGHLGRLVIDQLLASGTYTNVSPTLVEINMTSLVRNTRSKVNCALVSLSQLNCTTAEGAQFSLARRA